MIGVFYHEDKLGKRLVLILRGFPCAYGKCSFCPFVLEQSIHIGRILEDNRKLIEKAKKVIEEKPVERIAVFNGGSFHELPYDIVDRLTEISRNKVFEIEERSEYVSMNSLENLLAVLKPRKLIVRVGFETGNEDIREKVLRKGMPDSEMYRLSKLRLEARRKGMPVEIWTYMLFGMEGIPEESVYKSIKDFKQLFDGVIAVRYKKYLPNHPEPVPVSQKLAEFLEREADLVDWGEEQWIIAGKEGSAPE